MGTAYIETIITAFAYGAFKFVAGMIVVFVILSLLRAAADRYRDRDEIETYERISSQYRAMRNRYR